MKLLTCPINGPRPLTEFIFGGECRPMPDPAACSDVAWASYVHDRNGAPGIKQEWWYHSPSGTWLIARRNTITDQVLNTYLFADRDALESGQP